MAVKRRMSTSVCATTYCDLCGLLLQFQDTLVFAEGVSFEIICYEFELTFVRCALLTAFCIRRHCRSAFVNVLLKDISRSRVSPFLTVPVLRTAAVASKY